MCASICVLAHHSGRLRNICTPLADTAVALSCHSSNVLLIEYTSALSSALAGAELNPDLKQVHDYCKQFAPQQDAQSELQCRRIVASRITNTYLAGLVLNLMPESTDELIALIPDLAVRTLPGVPLSGQPSLAPALPCAACECALLPAHFGDSAHTSWMR